MVSTNVFPKHSTPLGEINYDIDLGISQSQIGDAKDKFLEACTERLNHYFSGTTLDASGKVYQHMPVKCTAVWPKYGTLTLSGPRNKVEEVVANIHSPGFYLDGFGGFTVPPTKCE